MLKVLKITQWHANVLIHLYLIIIIIFFFWGGGAYLYDCSTNWNLHDNKHSLPHWRKTSSKMHTKYESIDSHQYIRAKTNKKPCLKINIYI